MNQLVMERTVPRTTPAARPARRPAAPLPAEPPHEVRSVVGVVAGVLAILLLAALSFAQGWGRGPVAGPGELVVDSGIARVDGVISAARPQHAMPGMGTDDDPVAEGMRRISIDLTLAAGTEELAYSAGRFTLDVDGEPADRQGHRDVLPGEVLPAGTQLSGTILVDVPVGATTGTLRYDGGPGTEIVIPAEEEVAPAPAGDPAATDAGHGAGQH